MNPDFIPKSDFSKEIDSYLDSLKKTLDCISRPDFNQVLHLLIQAYGSGKTVFVLGNGGSAATASHMVTDFNKGISSGKKKNFRMMALNDNIPSLMAIANDIDYESVFVEQLKTFFQPGDYVIGISGSGNSKNVIRAIDYANERSGITIGFSGYNGGLLKQKAQFGVHIDIQDMQIVEDVHLILNHMCMRVLCETLE